MILVVGIGRCGTSLMIKFLKECGLKVGSDKWFKSMDAGLENRHTLDINQRLLRHYVKGEDINLHHVRGDIQELNFGAVKDTQFLAHPALIKEWASVRDDLFVIWMHRDPEYIVKSVYKNPDWSTPVYRTREDLIEQKCDEFEEALLESGADWVQYMYPEILDNPDIVLDDIDGLPDDSLKIWNDIRDNTKRKG